MMLTPDEITDRLRQAAGAVQAAELSEDLRKIGFQRALDELGLGSAVVPAAPSALGADAPPSAGGASEPAVSSDLLTEIGRRFELPVEMLERIYDVDDGSVRLAIKRSMLPEPDRKAAAMRDVSLLVVAGRQAAGDEQTTFADIREECEALNVLDNANFSTEVAKHDFRLRGTRNSRTAKANRHHFEEAARLIRRILGEAES